MVKVFVVDDHEMVRRGLADLLSVSGDIEVIGETAFASHARRSIADCCPDVAIIDVRLPDGSGIEVCRDVLSDNPHPACVMLTSYDDEQALLAASLAGASAYLLKDVGGQDLTETVRLAANGQLLLSDGLKSEALAVISAHRVKNPLEILSPQEQIVLDHIRNGMTNREIAMTMFLAEKTVKNYVSKLLMKLGLSSRTVAAVFAERLQNKSQM